MVTKTIYSCQNCGYQSPKWLGRCPDCAQWNSLEQESVTSSRSLKRSAVGDIVSSSITAQKLSDIKTEGLLRVSTNISELDRVLGGGLVKGSVVLIGGEPGIGKSTLMLQVSGIISKTDKVLYVSGEESQGQIKLRAERLGMDSDNLYLVNETNLDDIIACIKDLKPNLVVIDSIQIIYNPAYQPSAGSVIQVRESAGALTALAKSLGISIFLIGHITKEGFIAGPKILEHIVDSVIYFEGKKHATFRILRAIKNRFGPTDEVGIFSMGQDGLSEIKDPSGIFLTDQGGKEVSGTSIMAAIEGTRPLLVEVQALVSASSLGMARQRSTGFDVSRLILLIAVLEKNMGLNLSSYDVFLNAAGGIRVTECAFDLAACISIMSSFKNSPVSSDTVIIGEVGLASEVRGVSHIQARVNESQRMGFKRCIIPASDLKNIQNRSQIEFVGVKTIQDAADKLFN